MTLDKPNFVVIGAQKAGSTSLYHYLNQHPDIFMSAVKEPRFFSYLAKREAGIPNPGREAVQTLEAYQALFAETTAKAVGEATPTYYSVAGTAEMIKRYIPHARLIAQLRNPADRAYSHYMMRAREGREDQDFADAVATGRYLRGGFYHEHLSTYLRHFDREQIGIYLYDDLRADPQALMQRIFRFLGVDDTFVPDFTVRHNVGGKPRSQWAAKVFTMPRVNALIKRAAPSWLVQWGVNIKQLNYTAPPLSDALRKQLSDIYEADIRALEKLIDRDLSHWLVGETVSE